MDLKEKEKLFSEVYETFRHRIYRICYAYIYQKEEVEDLFQEIMINIWKSLDRFRGDSQLGTWVYRVAVNSAMLYNRNNKFHGKVKSNISEVYLTTEDSGSDDHREIEEKLNVLAKCISKLKKQDRIIISLILEGLSYDQISEVTGVTSNYVGVKVNRIKKQLFSLFENESHE